MQIAILREAIIACREKLRSRVIKCQKELAKVTEVAALTFKKDGKNLSRLHAAWKGKRDQDIIYAFFWEAS